METKLTPINSILELPIKSAAGNQRSSSTFNSTNETFSIGTKRKSPSDDSNIKEQSSGFEKALKEKININSSAQSDENESDDSEGTKDDSQEVSSSSDQVANVVAEPPVSVEQVAVQASIGDQVDLLNKDIQTLAKPQQSQNTTVVSDKNVDPDAQVAANTQTLSQQIDQGASDTENQTAAPIADVIQEDSSQIEASDGQSAQNDQMLNNSEIPQSKSSDLIDQTNKQVTTTDTKVEDGTVKNASGINPLSDENLKSEQAPQITVSDAPKQTENPGQIKTTDSNETKSDKLKSLKTSQDNVSQDSTKQGQPSQLNNDTQMSSAAIESILSSDNNTFEVKADNIVETDVTAKVDIHRPISIGADISTNTQQSESNKEVSQASNIENLSQSVAKQMLNSVNIATSRNQNQITVNLNPPELGRVTIKFTESQNQITGVLQVTKSQTRTEIENALPQIIRNLESSGIQVKRIDVEVYNQNNMNQQPSKDQGFQNSFSAQQDSSQNHGNLNHTANNTSFESNKIRVAEENADGYQFNSTSGSESINLFA